MLSTWHEAWLRWCKRAKAWALGYRNEEDVRAIRHQLQAYLQEEGQVAADPHALTGQVGEVYQRILQQTQEHNRNNITRTKAYLDIYQRHPELHWALLAHMVSRNGGYNMTDLKGDLISRAMEAGEAEQFFQFLERANWLIFADAYPQLLLYEASRQAEQPLFHLLPYFSVSRFMHPIWERFWKTKDSSLLTLALIVNEQNFIEERVVQNPLYQPVVESFEFKAQTLLSLTNVVFPYLAPKEKEKVQLAGVARRAVRVPDRAHRHGPKTVRDPLRAAGSAAGRAEMGGRNAAYRIKSRPLAAPLHAKSPGKHAEALSTQASRHSLAAGSHPFL